MIWTAVTGGYIAHLGAVPWYALPLPRRWRHQCRPVTVAVFGVMYPEELQRCDCGAWRSRPFASLAFTTWREKHSRRSGTAHSRTVL